MTKMDVGKRMYSTKLPCKYLQSIVHFIVSIAIELEVHHLYHDAIFIISHYATCCGFRNYPQTIVCREYTETADCRLWQS